MAMWTCFLCNIQLGSAIKLDELGLLLQFKMKFEMLELEHDGVLMYVPSYQQFLDEAIRSILFVI